MTMTTAETHALVLKDVAADYFLVPQATRGRGRVREEHIARLERIIAEQGDVHGHLIGLVVIAFAALALAGPPLTPCAARWAYCARPPCPRGRAAPPR